MDSIETLLRHETTEVTDKDKPLTQTQIEELRKELFGWDVTIVDELPHLWRVFKFENFADALRFTSEVGAIAESEQHHPKLTTEWGSVKVEWWSHDLGGLHQNDFVMASKTNAIYTHWDNITGNQDIVDEASEESFPASDPPAVGSMIE